MNGSTVPRRRRWPKIVFVIVVFFASLIWFAPLIVAKTGLRNSILKVASKNLRGSISVESMSLGWLSPIEIHGMTLVDDSQLEVIKINQIRSEKSLFALVRNQSDLGRFIIDSPMATISCTKDLTNIERVLEKYLDPTAESTQRPAISIEWTEGKIQIQDDLTKNQRTLEAVNGEIKLQGNEPIFIRCSATIPELQTVGSIQIDGCIGGLLTAKVEELPLDWVGWFARRFEPGLTLNGVTTGSLDVKPNGMNTFQVTTNFRAANVSAQNMTNGSFFVSKTVDVKSNLLVADSIITSDRFDLICDAGTASLTGSINLAQSPTQWINRPGLGLKVEWDAAKFSKMLPPLQKQMAGTEISSGSLSVNIKSVEQTNGVNWGGTLGISTVKAVRNGSPVLWEQPIQCSFEGRIASDGFPTFDKLQIASDFVGLNFRGSLEQFEAAAVVDLDRLSRHLADFIDMSGISLAGRASVQAWNRPQGDDLHIVAKMDFDQLHIANQKSTLLKEPNLKFELDALGKQLTNGIVRIDRGSGTLKALNDTATIELLQPIADLRSMTAGSGKVSISGEINRWRNRFAGVIALPLDWQTNGVIQATSHVRLSESGVVAEQTDLNVANVQFRGLGIAINDPQVKAKVGQIKWDQKSGSILLQAIQLNSEMMIADCQSFAIKTTNQTMPNVDGTLNIQSARMSRLAPFIGFSADPRSGDAIDGTAKGTFELKTSGSTIGFNTQIRIDQFRYGPSQKPIWSEPKVEFASAGEFDTQSNSVLLTSAQIKADGMTAEGKGTLRNLDRRGDLDITGNLTYDLVRIEPQVKEYLGRGGKIAGKDTRPFRITGTISNGIENIKVTAGPTKSELLFPNLTGNASVGWQSMRAYGFDVGPADLKANIEKGVIQFQPVQATFGNGRINAHPTLKLNTTTYELTFAKGRMIENARLTPAACSDALGFALPAIANSTDAEGLISVNWDEGRIPLADYTRMNAKGQLLLHSMKVTPGPVVRVVLAAAGVQESSFAIANEQVVPVWVENGRVHHRDFTIGAKNYSIRTSGSVGFDGSMQLVCEVPIPNQLLDQAFRNNPRIREAMAKKSISVPLGGTVNQPTLDARAFQSSIQKLIGEAAKDSIKDATGDLLKKELDKILPKSPLKKP